MQQDLTAGSQVQRHRQQTQPHRCAMAAKAGVTTAAALLTTTTLLLLLLNPLGAAGDDDGSVQDLRYRRRRGFRHRNAPRTPAVHPTPPPPLPRCNNSYAPEDSLTASGDDQCVPNPVPPRSPSPPVPPPRRPLRCPPCTCPRPLPQPQPPRPFTGWPWPVPRPLPVPGGRGPGSPDNGEEDLRWRRHHVRGGHQNHHEAPPAPEIPFVPVPIPVPVPSPPALTPAPPAPTPPTQEPCSCCDFCAIVPGPFLDSSFGAPTPPSPPSPPVPVAAPPAPVSCAIALAGLGPCTTSPFLTGRVGPPPTPQSACCSGLSAFLAAVRAAGPVAGAQRLRCLCPMIRGDVKPVSSSPIDPLRFMFLQLVCGVALPPETMGLCFGQAQDNLPTVANLTGLLH